MASENQDKAVLHYPGGEYEMPIVKANEGNSGFALGKLCLLYTSPEPTRPY